MSIQFKNIMLDSEQQDNNERCRSKQKNSLCIHSVLERIWIKSSYLSQWLPQGEKGPPKISKSLWIEILHSRSQFT